MCWGVCGGCARGVRVPALTTRNRTACEKCLTFSYETPASEVPRPPTCRLYCYCLENLNQGLALKQPTLLRSNFPINSGRMPRDAEPSPACRLSSCSRQTVHQQAGTASAAGWDLLLEAHSATYISSVPLARNRAAFGCLSNVSFHAFLVFE